jgi:hypothetical protein
MRTKSSFMNVKWETPVNTSIRLNASRADVCQLPKTVMPSKPSPRKMRQETTRISRTSTQTFSVAETKTTATRNARSTCASVADAPLAEPFFWIYAAPERSRLPNHPSI